MTATAHERIPAARLSAVDLRKLTEEQMAALQMEAMRRGLSLPELLGNLVDEMSRRILQGEGRAA